MKTNFRSIILVVAATAVVGGAIGYVRYSELRARRLEARLARVEAALYSAPKAPSVAIGPSKNGVAPLFYTPQSSSTPPQADSLEGRVEALEKEMSPHLELLGTAKPGQLETER
jgi:hypothetical protein